MTPYPWPADATVQTYRYRGAVTFIVRLAGDRLSFSGNGGSAEHAEHNAWASYSLGHSPGHVHDFDPRDRQDGNGQCRTCGVWDTHAFERRRTVDYGRYAIAEHWPADWHVSGGSRGVVFSRDGSGSRSTAFFEAYPRNPDTFVRGEGATLAEAEAAAWEQVLHLQACPGHDFETRGYTNGAGFCRHCGMFASGVFDVAVVGEPCCVCGERTNWSQVAGAWYCQRDAPSRQERAALRAAARAKNGSSGDSLLDELFDELATGGPAEES